MADPLVQALKALLQKHGRKQVAAEADVNDQTLYQIETGVKLPSGKARGVGRELAAKLDAAYPGWRTPQPAPPLPPHGFKGRAAPTDSEWAALEALRAFPHELRSERLSEIVAEGEKWKALRDQIIAEAKNGK